jgi:outer membrane receptor protein involved in Fe transport
MEFATHLTTAPGAWLETILATGGLGASTAAEWTSPPRRRPRRRPKLSECRWPILPSRAFTGRNASTAILVFGLLLARPAAAGSNIVQVDLPGQSLAADLQQFARIGNIDLLFDPRLVAGRKGVAIHGRFTVEDALTRLLRGTGLAYRRTDEGAFVIASIGARPMGDHSPKAEPTAAPIAVAEILVSAHRSFDADIRRSPDDIQPYTVVSNEDIQRAQADTTEELLRTVLSADTQSATLAQTPVESRGGVNSQVDLRGLGTDETLVLVDGRRLPQIGSSSAFQQPDLNGLPLMAIDRIETLSSTAGGIYGPGATGGVVNVVLKGDYQGGYLSMATGETTRGDAPEWRAEGGFGLTNSRTGTRLMLAFGHTESDGLDIGQRSFIPSPAAPSGAVNIQSFGGDLTLLPSLGGGSLGSTLTYLPLTAAPLANEVAVLLANAGSQSTSMPPDGFGTLESLLPTVRTDSLAFKFRQDLSERVEGFVDLIYLSDQGVAKGTAFNPYEFIFNPGMLGNPFNQALLVSFPAPGIYADYSSVLVTERITAGLIVHPFGRWTADVDVTAGQSLERFQQPSVATFINVDPFMGLSVLESGINSTARRSDSVTKYSNTLDDWNVRLGGPLLALPGGPLSLTLLGEDRSERTPAATTFFVGHAIIVPYYPSESAQEEAESAYAELRAPLTGPNMKVVPLRALELQLAVRFDRTETRVMNYARDGGPVQNSADTFSVTTGVKVSPIPGLTFRASVADGYLPPTPAEITPQTFTFLPGELSYTDPARKNEPLGLNNPITISSGGSPTLEPERALTGSVGVVAEPQMAPGLRLSVDITQIVKTHEIVEFPPESQTLLNNLSLYPERITRAPLTAADAANGYTAGVITALNTGYADDGRTTIDTVDLAGLYKLETQFGTLEFRTRATWEPVFRSREGPYAPPFDIAGYSNGPLKWRVNGGLAWRRGPWSISIDSQYYDSYNVTAAEPLGSGSSENVAALQAQGGPTVKSQIYFDGLLTFTGRLLPASPVIQYRLAIKNLFDRNPPFSAQYGAAPYIYSSGYSPYGDPRGRRFELSATAHF